MSMSSQDDRASIIPARLAFLAIYNPSLGQTDDTFRDQVVFYHSREVHDKKKRQGQKDDEAGVLQQQENEQLRQIGLAQGMVNFAQNFANGSSLDTVETEKSRIILHELEKGWWILASIDYTRIPVTSNTPKTTTASSSKDEARYEYSSKEISPPALLTEQLLQAHNVFRLHNGSDLENIFTRNERTKFCALLERFWTRFAVNWNVMLHGVPAADIFGGMRLAAGGELGIGVGEEEWGCGEREVLEDFASRTDGLVDLLVCRFGEGSPTKEQASTSSTAKDLIDEPWLGIGSSVLSSDGVIFSGIGAVSRPFMRNLSYWLQLIYTHGENAYAVKESSTSAGKRRKHKDKHENVTRTNSKLDTGRETTDPPVSIPRSIVSAAEKSRQPATSKAERKDDKKEPSEISQTGVEQAQSSAAHDETWKKVLKLGYGYSWGISDAQSNETEQDQPIDKFAIRMNAQMKRENEGYFIVGLQGDLEDELEQSSEVEDGEASNSNRRIMIRTVHMHEESRGRPDLLRLGTKQSQKSIFSTITSLSGAASSTDRVSNRLRVLVYVHRPFIYALLFLTDSPSLMLPTFYRDLHTFLSPLHPLLLRRTGRTIGAARRHQAMKSSRDDSTAERQSRTSDDDVSKSWEVVYDSETLATIASVPSVDEESTFISRGDALNLHSAAMEVLLSIQKDELERRVKTARGWWVGWAKVPLGEAESVSGHDSDTESAYDDDGRQGSDRTEVQPDYTKKGPTKCRQILLFRRANDLSSKSRARVVSDWGLGGGVTGDVNAKLDATDMGIGFDARRYVEGIMGTNK